MHKINQLDKSIYSLIAAGEVIDKPASVVKELLENSIDAGATNILVDIKDGGTTYIKVSDNGCGISPEDIRLAFLPHATSKIRSVDDLYNIGTLGFRGEALSTITAVSKVTMISKTRDLDMGTIIKINGGDIEEEQPIGCPDGTTVTSEDLFYNIPARKKFLKKAKSEESEITNIIARIILANPDVSIEYLADNKLIYKSSGQGLFDAIYAIYGKSIVDNLIPVDINKYGIKVTGYIGKVRFTKPNRTYQTLIVNGRYVINQTVSTAIYKAYENYIMKNNFPFYVLNMTINTKDVDVNVHPNKLDVKFSNNNQIFELFISEISKILIDSINIENVVLTNNEKVDVQPEIDLKNLNILDTNEGVSYNYNTGVESATIPTVEEVKVGGSNADIVREATVEQKDDPLISYDYKVSINNTTFVNNKTMDVLKSGDIEFNAPNTYEVARNMLDKQNRELTVKQYKMEEINGFENEMENFKTKDYKVIGTLFDTFIIVQFTDYIYLIDQHAGHERVLFDKLMSQYEKSEVVTQPLLVPYVITVNPMEFNYLENNLELLRKMGFDIDEFGRNEFRVTSVPICLHNINVQEFFEEILSNINNNKLKISSADVLRDFFASTACKHAIKAYDKLSESKIDYLLSLLQNTPILLCPHGRPIVLKITEKEIEKWFKRIV